MRDATRDRPGTRRPRAKLARSMAPRQRLPSAEKLTRLLGIKLNEEEHAVVHEAALLKSGRPNKTSDVFRPVLVRAARRILAARKPSK